MKRSSAVVVALLIGLSACSSDDSSAEAPPTIEQGKLIACTDFPYEPFEFGTTGSEKGIDVDLVKAIASDLHLTAEFRDTDFDSIFDKMKSGSCDLVASAVSITDERKESYAFSDGYFEVNQSLMVKKADAATLVDLTALQGKKIGVQKGTTGAAYAAAHAQKSTVVPFDSADELTAALDKSQIDAILQDFPINSYLSQTTGKYKVVKTFTDVAREQYGFALPQTSTELQSRIDKSLQSIRKDGRYDAILGRYLGLTS